MGLFYDTINHMTETGLTPEGLAMTIAGREIGAKRLDPVLGRFEKLTKEYADRKSFQVGVELRHYNPPIELTRKGQLRPAQSYGDLMREQAERVEKAAIQSAGGTVQGEYERSIREAKTEEDKAKIQRDFEEKFNPPNKEYYGYRDAFDDKQYATPLETVHGVAIVENQLFDTIG